MVNRNYRLKKTISMKLFISEFGQTFTEHMKNRLLELEIRCVLTRKDEINKLDIKHVEHTQYNCNPENALDLAKKQKEYVYGEFIVIENILYFSRECCENDTIMQSPIVDTIYDSLEGKEITVEEHIVGKKVDDNNIDYIVDTMLTVFPEVSQRYVNMVKEMMSHERN